jgi:hypothetical protein
MPVNGLLEAFPRTGSPDRAPGMNIRTYVATQIFASLVSSEAIAMMKSNKKEEFVALAIAASWARADQFLLGG